MLYLFSIYKITFSQYNRLRKLYDIKSIYFLFQLEKLHDVYIANIASRRATKYERLDVTKAKKKKKKNQSFHRYNHLFLHHKHFYRL